MQVLKCLPLLILTLLLYGPCSKKRPQPIPFPQPVPSPTAEPLPTPEPTATPTPAPATPTPAPTPQVDLSKYIPARPEGQIATVSIEAPPSTRSLSDIIQAAQDDPDIASVRIIGGGSFTEPVIFRKFTTFDSSTYSCDVTHASVPAFRARLPRHESDLFIIPVTNYGCFLVADNVYVGGTWKFPQAILDLMRAGGDPVERARKLAEIPTGEGTTILEPTFSYDAARPAVEVFQALGDVCCSHTGKAQNITIQGFRIKGRQTVYDGGVRSTILLGNCEHCAVTDISLEDTASIGVTAGGSGIGTDNFAKDIVLTRNMFSGVAAANMATINTEGAWVFENYVKRPGHHEPKFGGGVCGYDHETNSPADHTKDIWVYNNFFDYEGAHQEAAGTAICAQDPYVGQKQASNNFHILNNVAVGGREDVIHRYMSNGMFISGLRDYSVRANYIFRTGQNAMQIYNIAGGVIEDNIFDSTGGGGNPSFWSQGMRNTIVRRNNYFRRDLQINMQAGFMDICGENNQYIDNFIPSHEGPAPATKRCP